MKINIDGNCIGMNGLIEDDLYISKMSGANLDDIVETIDLMKSVSDEIRDIG